ncbi:MAG: type I DNA topoisomerase [Alphaproteobacteria bacterium]|nr:type I DNA topoisomerase [Alphaproteobacteria bacterium]
MNNVVVVESPAKAKTINKYLGEDYVVLASYGHVRDLPAKNGSVQPEADFAMSYEVDPDSVGKLKDIAKACRGAKHLILATDPDREGEAISWHVLSALNEMGACKDLDVKRVVFNEITKSAVVEAMRHPRDIDMALVNAQQARRALDYLVGFTLSPVLWRKLPGARSAGRVQSVALRLVCERDLEIDRFVPQEYWSIDAEFATTRGTTFTARLVGLDGNKLDKLGLGSKVVADAALAAIAGAQSFAVAAVGAKQSFRNPPPPFTTSTLQQEASRKLRFSARRTMQIAQRLYEGVTIGGETTGLITYMRTDGVQMANEAIAGCRSVIGRAYGDAYVPEKPRAYQTKAKNAQEAHEAIRPTDLSRLPEQAARFLDDEQAKLYELIWKRAIASQMASARVERAAIDIAANDGRSQFRATGQVVLFDGFLRLYQEGRDDVEDKRAPDAEDDDTRALPKVNQGDALDRRTVTPEQHFTEPPPRYTEATLVKKLEELGIGRPSTYASILSVLQDRKYVRLDKGRFFAEDRGQLVTAFLVSFFERYVQYDFTADLEERLDKVSAGDLDWKALLRDFWRDFTGAVDGTQNLRVRDVLEALNELLSDHVFKSSGPGKDPRQCPSCAAGRLSLKVGRFGAFVGCSNYPECKYTRRLADGGNGEGNDAGPRELGKDPATGATVAVRKGPYGHYIQRDAAAGEEKPKRVSIPKGVSPSELALDRALQFLSLPREIGKHPETGKKISAGIGRFGPYVRHDSDYRSLGADEDVLTVGLNRAVALLAEPKQQRRGPAVLRALGAHPTDGKAVNIHEGRYGAYVSHDGVNATLPAGIEPEALSMDAAVTLLAERARKTGGQRRGRSTRRGKSTGTSPALKKKTPRKSGKKNAAAE